jgi:hypothetical protein
MDRVSEESTAKTTSRVHMLLAARLYDRRGEDQKTAAINGSK